MAADLAIKEPCRVATTGNITLSGLQTIDGVALAANDRVLVRAQTVATQNGIYLAAAGSWTRAADFDGAGEATGGTQVFVQDGDALADIAWRVAGDAPVTPGTDPLGFDPEFSQDSLAAVPRSLKAKARERVSVLDYGAKGDGTTDDSAAIQAAIDANLACTILFPAGYTFLAAGIVLSGSNYDNTALVIEGNFLLKPYAGTANFQGVTYVGIAFHDVNHCSLDVPGLMLGNRLEQDASEQRHLVILAGVRDFEAIQFRCAELRGDGILILRGTLTETEDVDTIGDTSRGIYLGPCLGTNSADDGRNLVSIVCAEDVVLAGGISLGIGGIIAYPTPARMPGGLDIEPDPNKGHRVRRVCSGPWLVRTIGTSGIGVIGSAITDDATRDWNIEDVSIAPSIVEHTGDQVGGPLFLRCRRVTADVTLSRAEPNAGIELDHADFCDLRVRTRGCAQSMTVGYAGFVRDSHVHVEVENYTIYGLAIIGADRCRFTGHVNGPTAVNAYGVMVTVASRGSLTQTGNVYSVDVPYASNNAFGFYTSANLTLPQCVAADCALNGYSGYGTQFGFNTPLPTRNVQGRNFATAVPASGYWAIGDFVQNTSPAIASGKVLLGWSRLTDGSTHVGGTDWTPVYATTS